MKTNMTILILYLLSTIACKKDLSDTTIQYTFPEEAEIHEGTWLQWPHQYKYGLEYRAEMDPIWLVMIKELIEGENVHLIVYDSTELTRVQGLFIDNAISTENIGFFVFKTDDVLVRDNVPIFVKDAKNKTYIQDWGFNGWGNKTDESTGELITSDDCNQIPTKVANALNIPLVDLNQILINEGGSVEMDGNKTLMACEGSILNNNRNPGVSKHEVEKVFKQYLGVENFIWLKGRKGLDITDMHIDGFARFKDDQTIITMNETDLLDFAVKSSDINKLYSARNIKDHAYQYKYIPLTKNNVITNSGTDIGYKGSYINFYIGNEVVLVPNYNDPNDSVANALIQELYPNRRVVELMFLICMHMVE